MKKLLQINECLNFSTGKIAQQIGDLALKNGWESWIAYSGREKTIQSRSQLIKVGSLTDATIHYIYNRLFDGEGLTSTLETKKLIKRIEDIEPNIIHLHNIHDHWLNYEVLFKYLAPKNIPIIWTQHDCWSFTGGCMYYDLHNCSGWLNGCQNCKDKRALFNRAKNNYHRKIKAITALDKITLVPVSDWLGDSLRMSALRRLPIHTIHNGIDINLFKPTKKMDRCNKKFIVLGVAAVWDARKGLDDFIKLRALLPKDDFTIILVGLTKKQIRSLPDGVRGIERTQSVVELANLYSEADVFVNPTYSDNFPTTNLEALACGTPVITYNTGGSPEAIDEMTGRVVNQGDINALAQSIHNLKEHPIDKEVCRKRVEDHFDKERCFMDYITLYNKILNNNV